MLILPGSLHVPVSHGFHDGGQVPRMAQCVCAEVVSATIHHQVFGKTGFRPGPGKLQIERFSISN